MSELRSPFDDSPMPTSDASLLAGCVKAIADPARLQILNILHRHREPMSVQDVQAELGRLAQPTISHHFNLLIAAGLVTREKVGVYSLHRLDRRAVAELAGLLNPGPPLVSELITSHAWRAQHTTGANQPPMRDRACEYMSCGRPRTEHARSVTQRPAVDWSRWRQCPVCFAELGQPCMEITGAISHGQPYPQVDPVRSVADRPHGGRRPRTGGAS